VVLCSVNAQAAEVNERLESWNFTQAVVVDMPDGYMIPKLDFITSKPLSLGLPDNYVNPNGDLSTKRNIGLLLARMVGWDRVFFLDDDIINLEASDIREIAGMLGSCQAVGMRAVEFPDNSVACHGHRETGESQDVFISGSVLAVHCTEAVAFFPEIYNEDWFFFYYAAMARRLGRHSRDAKQLPYDPFADPERAARQEFGDVMAEGLYSLLHQRIGADRATRDYWRMFLNSRKMFLEGVLARSQRVEPSLRKRIASSIEAAMTWTLQIEPSMCRHYITLWQRDLGIWEERLKDVPRFSSVNTAFRELDLVPSGPSLHGLAGMQKGDGPTRDGIRRVGGLVRRAKVAKGRFEPAAYWNIDHCPLITGRHRGAPKPALALLSRNAEDAYGQQVYLTDLSVPVLRTADGCALYLGSHSFLFTKVFAFYSSRPRWIG
jgi:hypothetical protein